MNTDERRSIKKPTATCPHCGWETEFLKAGKIPTHDFPPPCRSVCPGSGREPKAYDDTPLWKDDPSQRAKDFFEQARIELRLYGFAVVKEMAALSNQTSGTMECPLCLGTLKFSVASNGHCAASCMKQGCIRAIE